MLSFFFWRGGTGGRTVSAAAPDSPLPTPVVVKGMRLPGVSVLLLCDCATARCVSAVSGGTVSVVGGGTVGGSTVSVVGGGHSDSGKAQWEGGKAAARSRLPS